MRPTAVALASLLFACTVDGENASNNAESAELNGGLAVPPAQQPPTGEGATVPAGDIGLRASPERVGPGASVTLTLNNGSRGRLGYNLCTSLLQTAAGEEVRSDRVCTMELRILEPGRAATYSYDLPSALEDGSYRFSTSVEPMDDGAPTTFTSNAIEVR